MAPYKDDHYLIVQPGSQNTLVLFGLEESLTPPTFSIPTKVYRDANKPDYFHTSSEDESLAVYPIVKGEIVDIAAFNFFLRVIVKGILKSHPTLLLNQIALVLLASNKWSRIAIETITQYVFETLLLTAFQVVPLALGGFYAYGGNINNSVVVDVGYEKSEITPIIDYQIVKSASVYVSIGGSSINEKLGKLLPKLSAETIEALKKSQIFEVLNEEDAKNSFFGTDGLADANPEDEGVLDIAAIVTSEKSTREILAEKEREKKKGGAKAEAPKSNSELEKNIFIDADGTEVEIGKERFQGSTELIESLVDGIYTALSKIQDSAKRQDCYDNIILTGATSKIAGFREELLFKLLVTYRLNSVAPVAGQSQAFRNEYSTTSTALSQVPQHAKFVKFPEYFSEWKRNHEDAAFLGGQIIAKQIFGHGNSGDFFFAKDDYLEKGPLGIWQYSF
ncbi:unnamed protein product [Kuraishia capsulata CBS 1993]|uniref:Actin-like protein ARP9 n=1 Tax=Kuraishia capsulata CBS 1993 TaxID=1382522 RepID=W6MFT5_9ASCO|nr:uncharacterized protein KUCA_T00000745001 [Kuraishia capsulata CBS 1993]CDK24779.1 unnamed protein product [Kuraishia capsulata CBS 1993]